MSLVADRLLSDSQRELLDDLRAYTGPKQGDQGVVEPARPHSEEFAAELADRGWWGLTIDPRYGGSGGGFVEAALFAEEIFRAQLPIAGYLPTFIAVAALNAFGSEAQRSELLTAAARGGVLAVSITEPLAGSDVASITTRARRAGEGDDAGWVIDGHKRWCTLAHQASHILIFCRTGEADHGRDGLSTIFVPRETDGLEITTIDTPIDDLTTEIRIDGVRVAADALLGTEGAGFAQGVTGLNVERMIIAASSLGLAQRAFDDALDYVKQRTQFGRPVGSFQAQQHRFAELATDLERTRLLVRAVAAAMDENPGRLLPREASMAKLSATELAKRCALEGMQAMGANGYATEYRMERYLRVALGSTSFGGTSEIQRNIIAGTLGLAES